jgi:DNA-binding NarL/FixJ family response regulator
VTAQPSRPLRTGSLAPPSDQPRDSRPKPQRTDAIDRDQAPTRILVVEDDFLIAMQTETALIDAGFDVVGTAANAEQAISLAREGRPSLVVMDIRLAGARDGIDAAGQLFRELNIRCIFATAHDDAKTRERAKPFAPLGWLPKPYTARSLVTLVTEAVSTLD